MKKATVLVVDGGGRGSALVQAYLKSPLVGKVIATPGNDLMTNGNNKVKIYKVIKTTDIEGILQVCKRDEVDLVDVCQDDAIGVGVVDALKKENIRAFGPDKLSGQIEWDKAWSRNFMKKFHLPIPKYEVCTSEKEGIVFIKTQKDHEWFIKAAGLVAGKGALYAANNRDAIAQIKKMKSFGQSGQTFLIEQCLRGEEFSTFAIVDGKEFIILGHAQDHKRAYDGDQGLNTGGMGCSSPPLVINKKVETQINSIFRLTTKGLAKSKRHFTGIIYLGGMIDKKGKVYIIEFNARFGDPEAEVILPAIKNDWYQVVSQVLDGNIKKVKIVKDNDYRIVVTAASRGYPGDYSEVIGKEILGLSILFKDRDLDFFGGATKKENGKYFASGTRLFYVAAKGKDVLEARSKVYAALSKTSVEGNNLHYRKDIGYRDLERFYKK